jgi:hypothetical protein
MNEFRDLVKEAKRLTDRLKVAQETSKVCENDSHELDQIKVFNFINCKGINCIK